MRRTLLASVLFGLWCIGLGGCRTELVEPQTPRTLRVLTYNIHHGEGMDERFDYDRLARVINDLAPDIVALQEVDCGTDRASGIDQAALLGRLCKMHHAFGRAMPHENGQYGEAVLSHFPIEKAVVHPLPYQVGQEPRAALEVVVQPASIGPIVFVGTHLCHQSGETRLQQTRRLHQLFSKRQANPIILAGDFNARPGSEPMNVLLDAGWVDVVAPRSAIDYILIRATDPWEVTKVVVADEPVASDHDPILAVLRWQGD